MSSSVRDRLFRGYGPLIGFAAAFLVIALAVPSQQREVRIESGASNSAKAGAVDEETIATDTTLDPNAQPKRYVVAWLIGLTGNCRGESFPVRMGRNVLGRDRRSDIVVNDGFMSTEHCQINCSPQGFTLVDAGSTNGCYVNDRKITQKHDLVDNDLVTLGKTNFKFKSIN